MQKCLAIGRGVKILDQKTEGGVNEPLASLRVNKHPPQLIYTQI